MKLLANKVIIPRAEQLETENRTAGHYERYMRQRLVEEMGEYHPITVSQESAGDEFADGALALIMHTFVVESEDIPLLISALEMLRAKLRAIYPNKESGETYDRASEMVAILDRLWKDIE